MYIIKDHFNFKFTIEGGNLQVMQKKDNEEGIIDSSLGPYPDLQGFGELLLSIHLHDLRDRKIRKKCYIAMCP